MDRRAIILGSWHPREYKKPSSQKIKSLLKRWQLIFETKDFGFKSFNNPRSLPKLIENPKVGQLVNMLRRGSKDIDSNTELLIYFVGHSSSTGTDDIELILSSTKKDRETIKLSYLLSSIQNLSKVKNLVLILDTCHAGRAISTIENNSNLNILFMSGAGSNYAYDANFSEGILRGFEDDLGKNDQRIDNKLKGVTYQRLFQYAQVYVLKRNHKQNPVMINNYDGGLLKEAPLKIPDRYHQFASDRSVYGRVFQLLQFFSQSNEWIKFKDAYDFVESSRIFLINEDENRFVSKQRIWDYIYFLVRIEWIELKDNDFKITMNGKIAANVEVFNKALLNDIAIKLMVQTSYDELEEVIEELLEDSIPPRPIYIAERFGMKGIPFFLDKPLRVALSILPSSGRFLKGSYDAIFPSPRGG